MIYTARLASIVLALIRIPTRNECISPTALPTSCVTRLLFFFFSFYQRYREWWHLDFFILAFLFMNEHHCIRVRAIRMSFSVNFLWTFFACFSFGSLIFFLQTSRNSVFGEISHFQWCDFQILFLVHYLCFNLQHFGHVEDSVLIFR